MPREPLKVAVVEDDGPLRESLRLLLDGTPGIRCVGAFADGESAVTGIPAAGPDVVIMDIGLPGMSGTETVRRLKEDLPGLEILMLTVFEDEDAIFAALEAGATGYLLKSTPPAAILEAVHELVRGGSPMTGRIARRVVRAFQDESAPPRPALSPREREILDLLAAGLRYREIARRLGISMETVRTHIRHIYEKLDVHSRTEAVVRHLRGKRHTAQ